MTASNFKTALQTAGLTVEQFAEILEVDPKTVRRWSAGRLPYPRHRAAIARALDTTEHALWPDDTPAPPPAADALPTSSAPRSEQPWTPGPSADGSVCEVTATWASPRTTGAPNVPNFLADACHRVDLLQGGSGILRSPGLADSLRRCAQQGAAVRVIADAITPELADLTHHPGIELRTVDQRFMHAVIRGDEQLLLGLWLAGPGPMPLMQLDRHSDDGVFDRIITHFDAIWPTAQPLMATAPATDDGGHPEAASDAQSSTRRWPRASD